MTEGSVLFVDDEARVLEGIENLLFDLTDDWDFDFATSGSEALEKLRESEVDVLVTDMRMPGMDGAELLRLARERHPTMVRVVLSGHTEQDAAARAMHLAHEFLSKPCDFETLEETLTRAFRLTKRFSDRALREALGSIGSLPARPRVYQELEQLLKSDAGIDEVAALVGTELAIATRLLHVANTAFYSRGRQIVALKDAVALLGLRTTRALVLSVETFDTFPLADWLDPEQLHAHSLEVGRLAQSLVEDRETAQQALLGGLLHDVGELLIGGYFAEEGRRAVARIKEGIDPSRAEIEVLGFDHAGIGAYLMRLWHLGEPVAQAVENHHSVGRLDRHEVDLAVFAADWVIHHNADCDSVLTDGELQFVQRCRERRNAQ